MKKLIITLCFTFGLVVSKSQVCNTLFSYSLTFEKVLFINNSNIQNAHYYWDFGDGTSSNFKNPNHTFAGNGKFLVTLYSQDTLSLCGSYYEKWINITKGDYTLCSPNIHDSLYYDSNNKTAIALIDENNNCNSTSKQFYFNGGAGSFSNNCFGIGSNNFSSIPQGNYIGYVDYYFQQPTHYFGIKTIPLNFNKAKNYSPCSANFEFSVLKQDSFSQTIHFKAMNKNAQTYTWYFTGFGDPIIKTTDTANISYGANYDLRTPTIPYYSVTAPITLVTKDVNGCEDRLTQFVFITSKQNTTVGINENNININEIKIYPNPTTNNFFINVPIKQLSLYNSAVLFDNLGRNIIQINSIQNNQQINIEYLSSGVYFLKINSSTNTKVFKIIKQ